MTKFKPGDRVETIKNGHVSRTGIVWSVRDCGTVVIQFDASLWRVPIPPYYIKKVDGTT